MNIAKVKILGLIKTHINYLSVLILVIGLNLRYSLPSLFPILNSFDIKFFGTIFIEFGILLFIGNWLIDKYKEDVNRILFSQIIDNKIGLRGVPLLTELMNLINPFSYNVGTFNVESHIKK